MIMNILAILGAFALAKELLKALACFVFRKDIAELKAANPEIFQ